MKLRAYDKYGKQHLIIEFGDDEIYTHSTSSKASIATVEMSTTIDEDWYKAHSGYGEDPQFKRWSDLVDVEIIEGKTS